MAAGICIGICRTDNMTGTDDAAAGLNAKFGGG